jgi:hypothetical protein
MILFQFYVDDPGFNYSNYSWRYTHNDSFIRDDYNSWWNNNQTGSLLVLGSTSHGTEESFTLHGSWDEHNINGQGQRNIEYIWCMY